MNGSAYTILHNLTHLRRGIYYGFDADELAEIKDEFPGVEVMWNIKTEKMELWSIGESGALPLRFLDNIPRDDMYKLHDQLREMRANALRYKDGMYAEIERKKLEEQHQQEIRDMVERIDPDKVRASYKELRGDIKPVSVPATN